jgi:hypothetical protein
VRTSPTCLVREIEFAPPTQREIIERLVAWRSRAAAPPGPDQRSSSCAERRLACAQRTAVRAENTVASPSGGARYR